MCRVGLVNTRGMHTPMMALTSFDLRFPTACSFFIIHRKSNCSAVGGFDHAFSQFSSFIRDGATFTNDRGVTFCFSSIQRYNLVYVPPLDTKLLTEKQTSEWYFSRFILIVLIIFFKERPNDRLLHVRQRKINSFAVKNVACAVPVEFASLTSRHVLRWHATLIHALHYAIFLVSIWWLSNPYAITIRIGCYADM